MVRAVEIAHESDVGTIAFIRTEVHDILHEGLVTPNHDRIYRSKSSEVLRVFHHSDDDTTTILTTRIDIHRAPEMYLALTDMEIIIGRIRQGRRSQIDILTFGHYGCFRSTGENNSWRCVLRVISTL